VASLLLAPSETRDRLTDGVYKTASPGYVIGDMEALLPLVIAAEPLQRKIDKAMRQGEIKSGSHQDNLTAALQAGIINADEARLMREVHVRTVEIVAVDDFSSDELRAATSKLLEKSTQRRPKAA
jgi:acyl-CoA dehydrogenase